MKATFTANQSPDLRYTPWVVKFPQDQIDYEDDQLRMVCEGYILNSQALLDAHPGRCLREIILALYQEGGMANVLNQLHGSFVLALHDKTAHVAYLANDLLSKHPLYYLKHPHGLLANSSFLRLAEDARAADLPLTFDEASLGQMMSRCSFLGSDTYVKEIRFLEHCQYIQLTDQGASIETYPCQKPAIPQTEEALIQRIDTLFTQACQMAVDKNLAMGYRPTFTLSAGMDSRCSFLKSMPICKAASAPTPLCLSYGAAGCMELGIASQLAQAQGCDLLIHEINPTGFIRDREEILNRNEGMMYYAGTTGLHRMCKTLDTQPIGLVITGLGGGEIMGDLCKPSASDAEEEALYRQLFADCNADETALKEQISTLRSQYASYNEYVGYQDIRTCHNLAYTSRDRFEIFSPFLYEELFLLLLQVPEQQKAFRRLYSKWYLQAIGDRTPTSAFEGPVRLQSAASPSRLIKGALHRLRRMLHIQSKWDMNPMETWMQLDENQQYLQKTMADDLAALRRLNPSLATALQQRYASATADEKLRLLTVSGMAQRLLKK